VGANHPVLQDKLATSPWPAGHRNVVFLIDSCNPFERRLLLQWIEAHRAADAQSTEVHVQLSDDGTPLRTEALANALAEHPSAIVAPVRISWLRDHAKVFLRPRIIDLIRGTDRHPPAWMAAFLVRQKPERVHLIRGEPDTVENLAERFRHKYGQEPSERLEDFAVFVSRQAAVVLEMQERRLQGGRYKVPRYVAQSLRKNREFRAELKSIAMDEGISDVELDKRLNEYLKEMVARPSPLGIDTWVWFCNFCLGLGYEAKIRARPEEIERIRHAVRNNPSVLLFTHKTYLDGFVVPKITFDNDFPMPHFFGGANLRIPVLSTLIPRAGGIYLKRTFQDNEIYKATMRQYIGYLMEKRFPLTWSFEGTRSRLGKLMPPKYGLLKYVVEAAHASDSRNLHIIPVTVSYDQVRDAEEYAREQAGVPKAPESLSWLIGYIRSLSQPMGKIYVDFGEPVVLEKAPAPDEKLALEKIAFQVAVEANKVTPITLPALVSMVLLGTYPRALTESEVTTEVAELVEWCTDRELRLSPDFDQDYATNMQQQLKLMIDEGIINRYEGVAETVYGIVEGQAPVASYCRNTIVHFFVNKAITELALIATAQTPSEPEQVSERFWAEVDSLRDLFKFEFFYPPSDVFREEIRNELAKVDEDWEAVLGWGPSGARRLLRQMTPHVAHMSLQMFVESYATAAYVAVNRPDTLDKRDEFVELCMRYGKQGYLQRRVSSDASIGKLLFTNAWKMLQSRGLVDESRPDFAEARQAQAAALAELTQRIEISRASSIASRGAQTQRDFARGKL